MLYRIDICVGSIVFSNLGVEWEQLESVVNGCICCNIEYKISIDESGELLDVD